MASVERQRTQDAPHRAPEGHPHLLPRPDRRPDLKLSANVKTLLPTSDSFQRSLSHVLWQVSGRRGACVLNDANANLAVVGSGTFSEDGAGNARRGQDASGAVPREW